MDFYVEERKKKPPNRSTSITRASKHVHDIVCERQVAFINYADHSLAANEDEDFLG